MRAGLAPLAQGAERFVEHPAKDVVGPLLDRDRCAASSRERPAFPKNPRKRDDAHGGRQGERLRSRGRPRRTCTAQGCGLVRRRFPRGGRGAVVEGNLGADPHHGPHRARGRRARRRRRIPPGPVSQRRGRSALERGPEAGEARSRPPEGGNRVEPPRGRARGARERWSKVSKDFRSKASIPTSRTSRIPNPHSTGARSKDSERRSLFSKAVGSRMRSRPRGHSSIRRTRSESPASGSGSTASGPRLRPAGRRKGRVRSRRF